MDLRRRFLGPGESIYGRNAREHKVVLASYPRSGNSLLRSLIEVMCGGIVTGSDTEPTRTLSRALRDFGMVGEGVMDERVLVVKSHFPERRGLAQMPVKRAMLLVRNPWDVIDSYFNMTLTNSHNTTMHDSQYQRFADLFESLAFAEIKTWCQFNRWWLEARGVELLVIRYEDLIIHTRHTLRRVAWFLNGCQSIEDTPWADGLDRAMSLDLSSAGPYIPRNGGKSQRRVFGSSLKRFSPDLKNRINFIANSMLRNFGYDESSGFFSFSAAAIANYGQGEREEKSFSTQEKEDPILPLAKRALRLPVPPPQIDTSTGQIHTLILNQGPEIRHKDSPYGRFMTTLRKSLTNPVIADDGQPLNLHEVAIARDCRAAENAANAALRELQVNSSAPQQQTQFVESMIERKEKSKKKHRKVGARNRVSMNSNDGPIRTKTEQLRLLRQADAASTTHSFSCGVGSSSSL